MLSFKATRFSGRLFLLGHIEIQTEASLYATPIPYQEKEFNNNASRPASWFYQRHKIFFLSFLKISLYLVTKISSSLNKLLEVY